MNTELKDRAQAILNDKYTNAYWPLQEDVEDIIDFALDFHKQELSRLGEIYVACNKNEAEYYLDKEGDLLPVKKLSLEEKIIEPASEQPSDSIEQGKNQSL